MGMIWYTIGDHLVYSHGSSHNVVYIMDHIYHNELGSSHRKLEIILQKVRDHLEHINS